MQSEINSAAEPATHSSSFAAPATDTDRVIAIDVLRGFALLGILVMNIQSFAMPDAAYANPTAYGSFSGANYWVWLFSHLLTDQKMMTIFSLLFGAGILLMSSRAEAITGGSAAVHYRRMGVLLVFGLLHGYLLWYGDILFSYALCGMVVYLFRRLRPPILLGVGLACVTIPSIISAFFGWSMQFWPPDERQAFIEEMWQPTSEMIEAQLAAYRGGWIGEIVHRAPTTIAFQTLFLVLFVAWRAGGLMLMGMGLFKLGVFSAARSKATYLGAIVLALLVGIPIVLYGVRRNMQHNWDGNYSLGFGGEYNYWGSMLVSGGWIGLIMLACKYPGLGTLKTSLSAVGRMALTNYLLQTLICTTLFYGRGFGLFGRVDRVGQILIVFAVWIFQLIVSPLWLAQFRFGPAEWLWRSLTYLKPQPMRRVAPMESVASGL